MWRGGHGGWGGWWWPGVVLMAVFMVIFVLVMVRMMRGTGMCGFRMGGSGRHATDDAERVLADRLARGEIDVDEYKRLQEVIGTSRDSDVVGAPTTRREHAPERRDL